MDEELENKDGLTKEQINVVRKTIMTVMISIISQLEVNYGNLWGMGVESKDLTKSELEEKLIWEKVRRRILDIGNNETRKLESKLGRR